MSKTRLIKRFGWYYPTERFHTFFTFPILLLFQILTNPINNIILLIYGLIVCIIILYQGQLYWKLKLEKLKGIEFDQEKNIQFFKKSKRTNLILISLMPLFFLIQMYLQEWDFTNNDMMFWGTFANVFAALEHINYYHIQLMVDNKFDFQYIIRNKKLKKASLAKDLDENEI